MASDDKKIKTNPASKNEVPSKEKSSSGVDSSKVRLRAPRLLTPHPPAIAGARARSRFLKLIEITGTRFSRRKRSDNSAAFFANITDAFSYSGKPMHFSRGCGTRKKARKKSGPSSFELIVHSAHTAHATARHAGAAALSFFGLSATMASVVIRSPAIDAAFLQRGPHNFDRVEYSLFWASKPYEY